MSIAADRIAAAAVVVVAGAAVVDPATAALRAGVRRIGAALTSLSFASP